MNDRHQITPYPIRMPPELREALEKAANAAGRSLHSEIILRLQNSYLQNVSLGEAPSPKDTESGTPLGRMIIGELERQTERMHQLLVAIEARVGPYEESKTAPDLESKHTKGGRKAKSGAEDRTAMLKGLETLEPKKAQPATPPLKRSRKG